MTLQSDFTGLLPDTPSRLQARLAAQIPVPLCAGREVEETLWDSPPVGNRVENQGMSSTCAANAGTSCGELVWFQATGEWVQLSRDYLYAKAGDIDGSRADVGRTLTSIIEAMQAGTCREDLMPFTVPPTTRIPDGCEDDASQRRVTHTIDLSGGYDSVRTVIGQNMGACLIGTYWPVKYADGYRLEHYTPTGRGGHARAWLFLSTQKDSDNRPWVWCANSHGSMAQHNGYELWSPQAINELLRSDPWGCTGITAMSTPEPKELDWTGVLNPFAR